MYLDTKFDFQEQLNNVLSKGNKTIGLLFKLQALLRRQSLFTAYETFIRPHVDYRDIIYDQTYNESFHQKMESIQYNATLAITGAIRGTYGNIGTCRYLQRKTLSRARLRITP